MASLLMIPALNEMFDLGSSRLAAMRTRVPDVILILLFVLAVATAFGSGCAAGLSESFHRIGHIALAVLIALVVFVTLDLDWPRRGLIRLDTRQRSFRELRAMFDTSPADQPSTQRE